MDKDLKEIINIAGTALKNEDKYLSKAIKENFAYKNQLDGILRINNERYYQFIIAKALIKEYVRPVKLEKDSHDLVVLNECDSKSFEIVIEMKRWMSSKGCREISGIKKDIQKLKKAKSKKSLMLIFSSNPIEISPEKNIKELSEELNIVYKEEEWFYYKFETKFKKSKNNFIDNIFWIVGHEVIRI